MFENLTIKQICNYIQVMDELVGAGVIEFDKNNATAKLCYDNTVKTLVDENNRLKARPEIKDILALIRYHYEGNEEQFSNISSKIANNLEKSGNIELASYIDAQMDLTPTFIPM